MLGCRQIFRTRICISDIPSRKRTDEDFIHKSDEEYHLRTSIFEQMPQLGLVTNIPLDYYIIRYYIRLFTFSVTRKYEETYYFMVL